MSLQNLTVQPGSRRPAGFTLVELIVVLTVIVLLLALSVPGLSSMHRDMRMNGAVQSINSMLTRAYYLSISNSTMTAVRFMPAEWAVTEDDEATSSGRQRIVLYQYVGTTTDPTDPGKVAFNEYFVPVENVASLELPAGIWVAPVEALDDDNTIRDLVLDGDIKNTSGSWDGHHFAFNADPNASPDFLNADDFLIVFDPQAGLRGGQPKLYPLRAFVPETSGGNWGYAAHQNGIVPYQRYGFSGVVVYGRESLVALKDERAELDELQDFLRVNGQPYLAHRFGGGLISGAAPRDDD